MSIQSIDTQVMVARTAEYSRENSTLHKRPELTQDFLAVQEKIHDAQEQTRVAKTPENEKQELRPDKDGSGGGGGGDAPNARKDKKSGAAEKDLLVSPSYNIIDIRV